QEMDAIILRPALELVAGRPGIILNVLGAAGRVAKIPLPESDIVLLFGGKVYPIAGGKGPANAVFKISLYLKGGYRYLMAIHCHATFYVIDIELYPVNALAFWHCIKSMAG